MNDINSLRSDIGYVATSIKENKGLIGWFKGHQYIQIINNKTIATGEKKKLMKSSMLKIANFINDSINNQRFLAQGDIDALTTSFNIISTAYKDKHKTFFAKIFHDKMEYDVTIASIDTVQASLQSKQKWLNANPNPSSYDMQAKMQELREAPCIVALKDGEFIQWRDFYIGKTESGIIYLRDLVAFNSKNVSGNSINLLPNNTYQVKNNDTNNDIFLVLEKFLKIFKSPVRSKIF